MYKKTINNNQDLQFICNIYNDITGRNRTVKLHRWEWFESPYKNKSYVVTDKDGIILGHHGVLSIKFNDHGKEFTGGKTENTIMKKGYGSLYFKNEQQMHKEYSPEYDLLITTAARGVIKKIREKLGYKVFSEYVTFIQIVELKTLFKKLNNKYRAVNINLDLESISEVDEYYMNNKSKFKFSQTRDKDFLVYRLLNNPYIKYKILKLYNQLDKMLGYIIYYENSNSISIEDILYLSNSTKEELLKRLFNHAKYNSKLKITLKTLKSTCLDTPMKGFLRKESKKDDSLFMIKSKDEIDKKSFYFTQLMNEGIM